MSVLKDGRENSRAGQGRSEMSVSRVEGQHDIEETRACCVSKSGNNGGGNADRTEAEDRSEGWRLSRKECWPEERVY